MVAQNASGSLIFRVFMMMPCLSGAVSRAERSCRVMTRYGVFALGSGISETVVLSIDVNADGLEFARRHRHLPDADQSAGLFDDVLPEQTRPSCR